MKRPRPSSVMGLFCMLHNADVREYHASMENTDQLSDLPSPETHRPTMTDEMRLKIKASVRRRMNSPHALAREQALRDSENITGEDMRTVIGGPQRD